MTEHLGRLAPVALAPVAFAPVSRIAQLAGADHDARGTRISAKAGVNRSNHLRQMSSDELAAVVLGHVGGCLGSEKAFDRIPADADRAELPFNPDVDQRVASARADRNIFHRISPAWLMQVSLARLRRTGTFIARLRRIAQRFAS